MRSLVLFFASTTILACGAPTQFISPEYTGKRLSGENLTICIDRDRIIINNPDDVSDDLGAGVVSEVYYNFLDSAINRSLPGLSTFKKCQFERYPADLVKKSIFTIDNKGAQIEMRIPIDNTPLELGAGVPTYILFVDLLQVSRDPGSAGTMVMGPKGQMSMMGGRSAALQTTCNYILWDNKNARTVSYGTLTTSSPLFLAMTKGTWQTNTTEMVRLILKKSPFYKEPYAEGY